MQPDTIELLTETLAGALKKLEAPPCPECSGSGTTWVEIEDCGSALDSSPPSHWEQAACEDCGGIGLDWEAAS